MKSLIISLIKLYQLALRPVFPPRCRFYPSCSDFASEAVARNGAWRGSLRALSRILRCHPFHPGGWDPVIKRG